MWRRDSIRSAALDWFVIINMPHREYSDMIGNRILGKCNFNLSITSLINVPRIKLKVDIIIPRI